MRLAILRLASSAILAIGLIVAAYLAGGRYTMLNLGDGEVARLDRFTGDMVRCIPDTPGCGWEIITPANSTSVR
jgi:hypothetical protein